MITGVEADESEPQILKGRASMIDEIGHKNRSSQNGLSEAAIAAGSQSREYEPPSDGGFASWEELVEFLDENPRRLRVRHWQANRRPDDVEEPFEHIELFNATPYIKRNQRDLPQGGHPRGHTYDSRIEVAREMEARWKRRLKPVSIGALGSAVVVFAVLAVISFIDYNNPDTTASREPVATAVMSMGPDLSMSSLAESGPPRTGVVPSISTTRAFAPTSLSTGPDPPRTGIVTPTTTTVAEPEWPKTFRLVSEDLWYEVGTAMVTIRATENLLENETAIWRFSYPVTMRVSMLRGVQCDTSTDTVQLPILIGLLEGSEASTARIDPRTLPGFEVSTCSEQVNPLFSFQLGVEDPSLFPAQRTLPSEGLPQAMGNEGTIYEPELGSGSWVVSEPMQTMFIRGYASSQTCLNRARDAMFALIWADSAQVVSNPVPGEGFGLTLEPLSGVTFLDVPTVPFAIDPVDLQIIARTSFVTNFELEAVTC